MAKYTPKTNDELKELVQDSSIYLGDIDISNVKVISTIFKGSTRRDFSGIELWDTSNVVVMNGVFAGALFFNHDINSWDTSNVIDMACMFMGAKSFNQPLNSWDTSNVVNMYGMFMGAKSFNQPLNSWDTSSVEFMAQMFKSASAFNQNINSWDVSSVRDNQEMFWDSGVSKLPKWYKKLAVANDYKEAFEEARELVLYLLANPRPKKPKIAPQDKPQSSTNDWSNIFGGSSQPALTKKSLFRILGATLFFVILAVVAINFDDMRRSIKRSNSKATTQTTKQQQTQPVQQPTANMIRCDDRGLLKHIIQSYKNFLVDVYQDVDLFTKWRGYYQQQGINVASAEEIVNSFKHNIINVRTKSSDEVNRQITCEAEIEEVHPIPQYKPYYSILDYRAQLMDNNSVEVGIVDIRNVDK